jgi:iron complex outermembrane receptor protein
MKQGLPVVLASSSILAFAATTSAHAADSNAPPPSQSAAADTLEEIVVTALRKEELLQDVSASVDVVTSQELEKYNILQFQDIQKVVPGLQLGISISTQRSAKFSGGE